MSRINDIADALVTSLNGWNFSLEFTAARLYRPTFDLKEMKTLHVSVVPKAVESGLASRTKALHDIQIDVGIQKKLIVVGETDLDELMDVVEEIADFVQSTRSFALSSWTETENNPVFSQEHLAEFRQFTSVLTFTFRMVEE